MFLLSFVEKWALSWPKADKGDFIYLFSFVEKWTPNRPKADKEGYYILNSIVMNHEPQILLPKKIHPNLELKFHISQFLGQCF